MTKEEKIKEAYGLLWDIMPEKAKNDAFRDFGFICTDDFYLITNGYNFSEIETKEKTLHFSYHRPKSLQGIEDNNGWTRIESEDDLPKEGVYCWVVDEKGNIRKNIHYNFVYKTFQETFPYIRDIKVTHYQPIFKPKPPIY